MYRYLIAFILFFFLLSACNKNKYNSKKLQKGEVWIVTYVGVAGEKHAFNGVWEITTGVDVTDSVATLFWDIDNQQDAICEWQFQDKAKRFQLNYVQQCEECDGEDLDSLDYLAHALTGNYEVEKRKRKNMKFTSTSTKGYPGEKVEIHIVRR